jgi:hypothetical protein
MNGFALVAQFTFQPSKTYAQYDLAALALIPDTDETMTVALASVDNIACIQVTSQEDSQQIQVTIPRKTFFIQMGR